MDRIVEISDGELIDIINKTFKKHVSDENVEKFELKAKISKDEFDQYVSNFEKAYFEFKRPENIKKYAIRLNHQSFNNHLLAGIVSYNEEEEIATLRIISDYYEAIGENGKTIFNFYPVVD